jgi:hypothetical protein
VTKNLAGTNIPPGNGGVTYPSPNEWPVTYRTVTGITNSTQPVITAPNHGFTNAADQNITSLIFTQVKGMFQINGQCGYINNVIDTSNFQVGIDTSFYNKYTSGGLANISAGNAPYDPLTNLFP